METVNTKNLFMPNASSGKRYHRKIDDKALATNNLFSALYRENLYQEVQFVKSAIEPEGPVSGPYLAHRFKRIYPVHDLSRNLSLLWIPYTHHLPILKRYRRSDSPNDEIPSALSNCRICPDTRPDYYTYSLLSQHVYEGNKLQESDVFPLYNNWKVYKTKSGGSGYFGAIYLNEGSKKLVLSHRGTDSIKASLGRYKGNLSK